MRGMCGLQILRSTAEGGPLGLLENLSVDADFRHQGMATKLLAEAFVWTEQRGLTRLQLLADKNNAPSLYFYDQQRWQSTQLVCLKQMLKK